ncbi:nicotinate (nicotinamide) nucleotide adenylyltransferase [Mycoplasmopsis bovirhinis]|uniref:nicotinate-nucleotide adenylyltransferase n=1 Tax=Mycoplasmopsis bovirhinis TaxID=29553 RepID=UPI000C0586EF|nr:nicotinate-nucleotide adenylyltransferase [Mycoplasmopsis bovirhinis]ATO30695.1 nicotinate (nicotinamide) nucleotide adenylyltransferase [Mycoplasmopsis bovirhinis]
MKIGIYGGSFDPIHKGHIKLANYVINELQLDKLLIVPTYSSPFKHKTISPQDKVNMINLVLEAKMELCDFEIKRNSTSYTIDTVKYLKNKYPNDELYLIIGSDNLVKLDKWKDIDLISKLTKIVCLKRTNKINKLNLKRYQGILLNNPIYDYSSTDYKKGYLDLVDLKVANYIQANGLYLEKIIHNSLTALRAKHSMACGAFAAELAKAHGYDAKKAYLAGIMHDIAKEWSEQASREFLAEYAPEYANVPKHFLHQHCSAMWAKHGYLLKDQEIIDAINCHTEMKEEMKVLDKILFIADKICQGRKFPGIQKVRQLSFEDLEQGFAKVVKITYQLNISKGVIFSNESLKLYQKHMEK